MDKGNGRVRASVARLMVVVGATALAAVVVVAPADGAAVAAPAAVAVPVAATAQMTSFDQQMITLINGARAKAGAPKLTEAKGLTSLAVWWSSQMNNGATSYNLAHNPNAWTMVTSYGASNRTSWGENVAWSSSTATTAQQIFTAYMNSPGHKANILSKSYHYIGMGTVGGTHGLFNTTEFTDQVQAGQAVVPVKVVAPVKLTNGLYVRDAQTNAMFVIVGGAPVYISSWKAVGGVKPYKVVSHTALAALSKYPADGTFIRTPGNNAVYRMAGGAPLYVSSWAPFGGAKATATVDPAAVANAGKSGVWEHLRWSPVDNTVIVASGSTSYYRTVSGKIIRLTSWAQVGGKKPYVVVDPKVISSAGKAPYFSHVTK